MHYGPWSGLGWNWRQRARISFPDESSLCHIAISVAQFIVVPSTPSNNKKTALEIINEICHLSDFEVHVGRPDEMNSGQSQYNAFGINRVCVLAFCLMGLPGYPLNESV